MKKIAVSISDNRISPRFDTSEDLLIITIEDNIKTDETLYRLSTNNVNTRINMLLELKPDAFICGGISGDCELRIMKNRIEVFSWIRGLADDVINDYLNGKLTEKRGYESSGPYDNDHALMFRLF